MRLVDELNDENKLLRKQLAETIQKAYEVEKQAQRQSTPQLAGSKSSNKQSQGHLHPREATFSPQ